MMEKTTVTVFTEWEAENEQYRVRLYHQNKKGDRETIKSSITLAKDYSRDCRYDPVFTFNSPEEITVMVKLLERLRERLQEQLACGEAKL